MPLSAKEMSLLQDLRSQEQLCVEKYAKYAIEAADPRLQALFSHIGQTESQHLQTIDQLSQGQIPATGGGQPAPPLPASQPQAAAARRQDAYLCSDALAMEKHVSGEYNTCIFEFTDPALRSTLNHIQKEEQQHGLSLYDYLSQNGMYN